MANGEVHDLDDEVLVGVPGPGVNLQPAPGWTEINGQTTLACCGALSEKKAEWILTGPLYKHLFDKLFEGEVPPPQSLEELWNSADDVKHATGLIIEIFEAISERGEKVFLKNPETHLHPKQARCLMSMLNDLLRICGATDDDVQVAEDEEETESD